MRLFPVRSRARERKTRNEVQVIRDKVTGEEREVCHGDAWQARREEVWLRDGKRCVDCNVTVPLHKEKHDGWLENAAEIHHLKKRKAGGGSRDDRPHNLVTLCQRCHNARTARGE